MQTASVKWIGDQKFAAVSPSGHSVPIDSDRDPTRRPDPWSLF